MIKNWGANRFTYDKRFKEIKKKLTFSELVFVYGTLKRGGSNNYILSNSECIGQAWASPLYNLWDGIFPYATVGGSSYIRGELYNVTDKTVMDALDLLEGVPHHYIRRKEKFHPAEGWSDYWMNKITRKDDFRLTGTMYVASNEIHEALVNSGFKPMKATSLNEVWWPMSDKDRNRAEFGNDEDFEVEHE